MSIDREDEALVREAEYSVNRIWRNWRETFESKSSKEVLAMVAFQFAKLYYQQVHTIEGQVDVMEKFEAELDRLLQLTTK